MEIHNYKDYIIRKSFANSGIILVCGHPIERSGVVIWGGHLKTVTSGAIGPQHLNNAARLDMSSGYVDCIGERSAAGKF